jgi:hypothetical protein
VEIVVVHDAALPYVPALQVQAARAELAIGELELVGHVIHVVSIVAAVVVEYVPAPQSAHAVLPVAVLYLPATQAVHAFPAGHVVSVMSTPFTMAFTIAAVASVFRYSSTKKRPAMSPFVKYEVADHRLLPV